MEPGFSLSEIDTTRPHPARMYDSYLGGKDNYPADREAARQVLRARPKCVRSRGRTGRSCSGRCGSWSARRGYGSSSTLAPASPPAGNVHEVAGQVAPGARVVYVDNDPIVHVHANALLDRQRHHRIVLADLREPDTILAHPRLAG